jgi:RNA recognition motif-containing protein
LTVTNDQNRRVYVGGLPWETSSDLLSDLFNLGERAAERIDMPKDRESGEFRGFAFVTMKTDRLAQVAVSLFDGFRVGNRQIRVRIAEARK